VSQTATGYTCRQIVPNEQGKRESCDRPLANTEYVCQRCVRLMRDTLTRCYAHLDPRRGRWSGAHSISAAHPGTGTRSGQHWHGRPVLPPDLPA
jgi:hypothetical protein